MTGPVVVVEWQQECPQCRCEVTVLTDGLRAVVSTGTFAPRFVVRSGATVVASCGAPYAGDVCGEVLSVPLTAQDAWRAATEEDRRSLDTVEPLVVEE